MSRVRFKRWVLNLGRLRRRQLMRPLRHRLRDRTLWSFERQPLAKGAALGVFFAVATPVAQIVFAIVAAIVLRANVMLAIAMTFVGNPLTLPFVYYWAYGIGALLLGESALSPTAVVAEAEAAAAHAFDVTGWYPVLADWLSTVGPRLALGVVILALSSALVAYGIVYAIAGLWSPVDARPQARPRSDADAGSEE